MSAFLTFIKRLDQVPIFVACLSLFILMLMTFCDVILRSTFNAPIEAATELTRIFVAIVVFAVLPHVSALGQHISVDLTDSIFTRLGLDRIRDGLVFIVCGVALYWPTQRVIVLAERARDYGDVTEYLSIPQFYMMWFIAIATAITAVSMVVAGVLKFVALARSEGEAQ